VEAPAPLRILVVGSGGREHAICWKLRQSPRCGDLYCAPGNPGIASLATCVDLGSMEIDALRDFARAQAIDLTVVGPEVPLVAGIVDRFLEAGLPIVGPTAAAARLEGSKAFAKEFMGRHRIPTAAYRVFHKSDHDLAFEYIRGCAFPIVLKADGPAAGKGVVIAESFGAAEEAIHDFFTHSIFGVAGDTLVIEEFLHGVEASVFAATDGESFVTLAPAQDHKRIFDGDRGKNTGGMGAYAPAHAVTPEMLERVREEIIRPTIDGMRADGAPFAGFLFCGLMLTAAGPKVIEFNCRLGDPETQVVLPLVDADFAELCLAIAERRVADFAVAQHNACAVCVVLASGGYPDSFAKGKTIRGLGAIESEEGILVFHAGTAVHGDHLVTAGGRVLGVTAIARDSEFANAIELAYRGVERISFDGAYYRSDIGRRAL
jgi:phosphoribosylamine--glycine ligase